jgi:hypothetical protein
LTNSKALVLELVKETLDAIARGELTANPAPIPTAPQWMITMMAAKFPDAQWSMNPLATMDDGDDDDDEQHTVLNGDVGDGSNPIVVSSGKHAASTDAMATDSVPAVAATVVVEDKH